MRLCGYVQVQLGKLDADRLVMGTSAGLSVAPIWIFSGSLVTGSVSACAGLLPLSIWLYVGS
jgi:hypothetical protein